MRRRIKAPVVAIDGPVAAGKSTIGQRVARTLGCTFVDTGLMYRAVALLALTLEVDVDDGDALGRLVRETVIAVDGEQVWVDGEEVGAHLRRGAVEASASRVSSVPQVREALVARQRELAARGGVVMAGRDIGTVVLQDAPVKIFLSASSQERGRRRYQELVNQGQGVQEDEVLYQLLERDRRDTEREASPLRPAADAHIIDTEDLSLDEVVKKVLALVGRNE